MADTINDLTQVPMPEGMERVESGPLRFGDDWPGYFIRGDNALALAAHLSAYTALLRRYEMSDPELMALARQLDGLRMMLERCDARNHREAMGWEQRAEDKKERCPACQGHGYIDETGNPATGLHHVMGEPPAICPRCSGAGEVSV